MQNIVISKIDKYKIEGMVFTPAEVLHTTEEREERWRQLNHGMTLGNIHKLPTRITFMTQDNKIMETEATIWAVTEKNVILKNNIMIPIRSITAVRT